MMRRIYTAAWLAIGLAGSAVICAPVAGKTPSTTTYTVRKGDTLYTLAERYFVRTQDFIVVQRLNGIGNPRRIPVGRTLRIPRALLRQTLAFAHIEAFSGPVRISVGGRSGSARVGLSVGEGSEIETGANAFVTLRLPDASAVSIPSQSRVRIGRMRQIALTGSVERQFDIEAGRVRAVVTPMADPDSNFRVSTPVAVSAVRGTEFRAGYTAIGHVGTTEVVTGQVAFMPQAGKPEVLVPAGFGTSTLAPDGAGPVTLLPAPKLIEPGRIQSSPTLTFALTPVPEAVGYSVQIARDAGFLDIIGEDRPVAPRSEMPALPDGTYFVRLAAIDRLGLEGLAETYAFERSLNTIDATLERGRVGRYRQYLFRWASAGDGVKQFRFQLSAEPDGAIPLIDEAGLTTKSLIAVDLPVGDYSWRVMSLQFVRGQARETWLPAQRFHVAPGE